jgi:hypothetical protein
MLTMSGFADKSRHSLTGASTESHPRRRLVAAETNLMKPESSQHQANIEPALSRHQAITVTICPESAM